VKSPEAGLAVDLERALATDRLHERLQLELEWLCLRDRERHRLALSDGPWVTARV